MARRRRKTNETSDADVVPRKILKHAEALGFASFEAYGRWCVERGFPAESSKSWSALQAERETRAEENAAAAKLRNLGSHPKRAIELVCKGEIAAGDVASPRLRPACVAIETSSKTRRDRKALLRLLLFVESKASFLFDSVTFGTESYSLASALVRLNERRGQWIRPLEEWKVKSHNARRQFGSLLRHLLATYDVPAFMDSVWVRSDRGSHRMRDWFILIGSGGSLRKERTPVPLTKKMMHHFMQAPSDYAVEGAFRWGQVRALGGNERLCDAIVATRIGDSFAHEPFWITVIRFLAGAAMLDPVHVGPIVDYLHHQRFETRLEFTGPGVREELPPPQPNLSMRGRTIDTLLRQVDAWHDELGRTREAAGRSWPPSGIEPFELETGTKKDRMRVWRIRELLSSSELRREGRKMRHCVATYAATCARGASSIWTLERVGFESVEKLQTIEVNRYKVVVESRGRYNSRPGEQELKILRRWAQEAGLQISRYVDV